MNDAIDFDHNATTPIDERVKRIFTEALAADYGNPAAQHSHGRRARRALEQARDAIARTLGAKLDSMQADRVLFTSGGTEANQLVLLGGTNDDARPVIASAIEHPSVSGAAKELTRRGIEVRSVGVDRNGVGSLDELAIALAKEPRARLVSLMAANNETGVIQPIQEAAKLCRAAGVPLHCDAVQAVGRMPVSFRDWDVDALTIAPHKLGGPIGIGVLIARAELPLYPLFFGGFQQGGIRPGTEGAAIAIAAAAAIGYAVDELDERIVRFAGLRDRWETLLEAELANIVIHGRAVSRLPNTSNCAFVGIDRQQLLLALDSAGISCSTGSACASGSSDPSPVLTAMGLPTDQIASSLRFSFGSTNTLAEVEKGAERISRICKMLRR